MSGQLVLVDYMNHKKEFLFDTLTNISDAELNEQIEELLKHPILKSNVETIQLTITPSKGWFGNEKYERINDFNTKVYDVVGFEYALSSRHAKPNYTPEPNDNILIPAYYFKTPTTDKKGKGYGLLYKEETITRKEKAFHGTIWFCDSFPRRAEELLPIFEILAPKIQHFQKLKHFIETKLPKESGFPIKLGLLRKIFVLRFNFLKKLKIKIKKNRGSYNTHI